MELQSIPMDNRGRAFLLKAGFTTSHAVLLLSPLALSKRVKLPLNEINSLLLAISQAVSNHREGNVMDLIRGEVEVGGDCITTGDDKLDQVLMGGIRIGSGITEISGEASTGKSHLALQLSLTVQLPLHLGGQSGSAIYLTTESHFPSNRLLQLAQALLSRLPPESEEDGAEEGEEGEGKRTEWDYLDNVHLSSVQDLEALEHTLDYYIPNLISHLTTLSTISPSFSPHPDATNTLNATNTERKRKRERQRPLPPKLLIIDSIAAPFRHSHHNNFIKRSQDLTCISDKLKRISWEYDLAILVINQVTSVITPFFHFPSIPIFTLYLLPSSPPTLLPLLPLRHSHPHPHLLLHTNPPLILPNPLLLRSIPLPLFPRLIRSLLVNLYK